jgi:hypothetical protein
MGAASRIRVWRRPLLRALLVSFVACWCDCASEAEAKTVRDARPRRRPSAMQLLGLGNWASPCLGGSACRPAGLGWAGLGRFIRLKPRLFGLKPKKPKVKWLVILLTVILTENR